MEEEARAQKESLRARKQPAPPHPHIMMGSENRNLILTPQDSINLCRNPSTKETEDSISWTMGQADNLLKIIQILGPVLR